MALLQYARGIWASFAQAENPFQTPNGMEENLRVIDDHLAFYTLLVPQAPGTAFPAAPADGDGQIYTNGTYAAYNGGAWKAYPPRKGIRAVLATGTDSWLNTGTGWEQFSVLDTGPATASAQAAATAAATASDIALARGRTYVSGEAGVNPSGTPPGVGANEYFTVPSPTVGSALDLYKNVAGVAVLQAGHSIPNTDSIAQLQGAVAVKLSAPPGSALAIHDGKRVLVDAQRDGNFLVVHLWARTINGKPVGDTVDRHGGVYPYQINYHNNAGESLGEGSTGTALTTVAEYDSIGFPARASSPGAFVPLDVASTQYAARGESPMYGALGFMKQLISVENGLAWQQNDFQLLACNNGYSGQKLAFMIKGTAPYTAVMSQATSGKAIADATGKSFGALATFLTIGANDGDPDTLTPTANFKSQLLQYASDLSADFKAVTGQTRDVPLILGQLSSRAPQLAVAQLEASNESGLIVVAAPMYFLTYYDTLHINPESEKWLGGYYGAAEKRVIVDRLPWEPLQPVSYVRVGSDVYMTFNKSRLAFDTALVSAQVNAGFDCTDSVGAPIALSGAPQIVGDNVLRFSFASAPPAGALIRAGHVASVGRADPFVGGSCNLRDNAGDRLKYTFTVAGSPVVHAMHNWCVIFSQPI